MTQAARITSGSDLERFSAEELAARLSAVHGRMRAEGLDVVLIYLRLRDALPRIQVRDASRFWRTLRCTIMDQKLLR